MRKFEAQDSLRRENGRRNIKESKQRKLKPKAEVTKIGYSGLGFRMVRFSQNR
jgi:hypothetical protein